jgi:hypothetical protein
VVPVITIETPGESSGVGLTYGSMSVDLRAGTHKWPELVLTPETDHVITFTGAYSDVISFTFRRAVLE